MIFTRDERRLAAGGASGLVPAVFAGRVFPYAIRICIILISILNHLDAEPSQYPHEFRAPQYTLSCHSFACLRS